MTRAKLFTPFRVGEFELVNRIVIAPMCQYSAENGCMTDWHLIHLGQLALSGAALLTIEATAVLPEGRITYADVGLYSDECEAAMQRVLDSIRRWSDMPIALQLAHAGRKASTEVPWKGGKQIPPTHSNGWQTVAPSAIPHNAGEVDPHSIKRGWPRCAMPSLMRPGVPPGSALARFRSMRPTVTCSTSSCRLCPTGVRTPTVVPLRTGCASRLRCSMPSGLRFQRIVPSPCGCQALTGPGVVGPLRKL